MTTTRRSGTCIGNDHLDVIAGQARPWAPGRREDDIEMQKAADSSERLWCMSEVDMFCDLDEHEMESMSQAAPMRLYPAGSLLFSPHQPVEVLFILKKGRSGSFGSRKTAER